MPGKQSDEGSRSSEGSDYCASKMPIMGVRLASPLQPLPTAPQCALHLQGSARMSRPSSCCAGGALTPALPHSVIHLVFGSCTVSCLSK